MTESTAIFYKLTGDHSILSDEGTKSVLGLLDISKRLREGKASHVRAVVVEAEGSLSDGDPALLSELMAELLLDQFAQRLRQLRKLLAEIRYSAVPWVFVADGDVFGAAAELCLMCHFTYFRSLSARLGFPEIKGGNFPAGGWFEAEWLNRRRGRRHEWEDKPVLTARDALTAGFLDGVLEVASTTNHFEQYWPSIEPEIQKQWLLRVKEGPADSQWVRPSIGDAVPPANEQGNPQWKSLSAWDAALQFLKEVARTQDHTQLDKVLVAMVARHVFTSEYLRWLSKNSRKVSDVSAGDTALQPYESVLIDVNQLAPPLASMVALLESGMVLVFLADSSEVLKKSLDVAHARLERRYGAKLLQEKWRKQIYWFVGDGVGEEHNCATLAWTIDDLCRIKASPAAETLSIYRLSGNRGSASLGCAEVVQKKNGEVANTADISGMVAVTAKAILLTTGWNGTDIPISVVVRSLLFCEMLRLRSLWGIEFSALTEMLREQQWGFAGDDERWEQFLRFRPAFESFFDTDMAQGLPADPYGLTLASLRELKGGEKLARKGELEELGRGFLSHHLQLFLTLLSFEVVCQAPHLSRSDVDLLVTEAAGWPENLLWPSQYLDRVGENSMQRYLAEHWSQWRPALSRVEQ